MRRWMPALVAVLVGAFLAGRGDAGDRLPTVRHEGRPYVELVRVATSARARLETPSGGVRARLRTSGHVVTLTRDRSQVLVDGKSVALDGPVVVRRGAWLVPESFVQRVVPRLVASPRTGRSAAAAGSASPPRPQAAASAHGRHPASGSATASASTVRAAASSPLALPPAARPATAPPARTPVARPAESIPVTLPPAVRPAPSASSAPTSAVRSVSSASPAQALEAQRASSALSTPTPAVRPAPSAPSAPPAPARPGSSAGVTDLRYRSYPDFTRLVLETSAPVAFRMERNESPEVVIRVDGLAARPRAEGVDDGRVKTVRLEPAGADSLLRVALAGGPVQATTSTLADPPRLVVDIRLPERPAPPERRPTETPLRTIVLDAGHGGHDSGAVGPTGLMEKDLVLDVTRRVARLVEARLDVKVLLSRSDDHFVPLRERTSFANHERADLFVSIHANAHPQRTEGGVETFFLSSEATDGAARRVAAAENSVVQLESPVARGRADVVKAILWDLAQSAYQRESSRLAEVVQDSMTRTLHIPNRGVKQAGFYVLGGAAMPAILIEIGFVTNPGEESRLKTDAYRDEIAQAILAGLAEYRRQWDRRTRVTVQRRP